MPVSWHSKPSHELGDKQLAAKGMPASYIVYSKVQNATSQNLWSGIWYAGCLTCPNVTFGTQVNILNLHMSKCNQSEHYYGPVLAAKRVPASYVCTSLRDKSLHVQMWQVGTGSWQALQNGTEQFTNKVLEEREGERTTIEWITHTHRWY